jgi:hypothetical protein
MAEQPNPYASPAGPIAVTNTPVSRRWYFAALALFALAIVAELFAKREIALARQIVRGPSDVTPGWHMQRSGRSNRAGMICAALGICSWFLCGRRRERVLHGVPIVLLVLYVLLWLLLV